MENNKRKRFLRFLFDGGFTFDSEYIPPVWSIQDLDDPNSPFSYLEFQDEHSDLCDQIVDLLNDMHDKNKYLEDEAYKIVQERMDFYKTLKAEKDSKAEIEFKLRVLEKWYTCPSCAFSSREFKYLRSLRKQ